MFAANPSTLLLQWPRFVRSFLMKGLTDVGRRTGHHYGEEPVFIFNIRMYGKSLPWLTISVTVRDGVKKKDLRSGELDGAEEFPKSQGCCCVSCCLASQFSCDLVS